MEHRGRNRYIVLIGLTVMIVLGAVLLFRYYDGGKSSAGIRADGATVSQRRELPDETEPVSGKEKFRAKPSEKRVSFAGAGDNLIHAPIYHEARKADGSYDFSYLYTEVKDLIGKADLSCINEESVITGNRFEPSGYPRFNTPEEMAENLKTVGFDLVNMANNHILDCGPEGIDESIRIYERNGLIYGGAYKSQEDRDRIRVVEKNGIRIAFLWYTYGTNDPLPDNSGRVGYLHDRERIESEVKKARNEADFVLVSVHWGEENVTRPSAEQKAYAKLFSDAGVDVVLGTHPHVIQPVEWLTNREGKKTLIVYSTGNFVSAMFGKENLVGCVATFDFVKEGKRCSVENVKMIPIVTHFEGRLTSVYSACKNFKIYLLSDYTDTLAARHGLNVYHRTTLTQRYFQELYEKAVPEEFRP